MHDFSVWLRTGSNQADIVWFGIHTGIISSCVIFAMNVSKKTVEKLHHMKIKFNWRKLYAYKQDLAPRASAAITPQT